jgi:putative oxidoreductase
MDNASMERYLGRYAPYCFAVLRIVAGLMFAMHGTQKLFGWPGNGPPSGDAVSILAGIIEAAGGVLIAIGLFAGWAAFLASGEMAVAYFWRHQPEGLLPLVNRGELAVLYCFLWLFIAAHGPGGWSVEGRRDHSAL